MQQTWFCTVIHGVPVCGNCGTLHPVPDTAVEGGSFAHIAYMLPVVGSGQ